MLRFGKKSRNADPDSSGKGTLGRRGSVEKVSESQARTATPTFEPPVPTALGPTAAAAAYRDETLSNDERPAVSVNAAGSSYTRERSNRAASRQRSMDIYKKALAEGKSADDAASQAGVGTTFASIDELMADEEANLVGGDSGQNTDYTSWSAGVQPGFKKKWADYGDGPQGISV